MPDLRFRLESALLRGAMALPPSVQRKLLRRPVVRDDQVLAPELQLMLALQRLARLPGAETLPLDKARREIVRQSRIVGGRQTVGALRNLEVDGADGPLRARLYIPNERTGADPAPTMLFFHGGGWMYGDLESHDAVCRLLAERSGVQLLAVDYRLSPEHRFPAAVEDCKAAYRWLVDHADEVNADPTRLAVGGDSAGGNLAAVVAVYAAEHDLPLAFQLLVYPGTDFVERSPSRRSFGQGFYLTDEFMDGAEEAYFGVPAGPAADPTTAARAADPTTAGRAASEASDQSRPPVATTAGAADPTTAGRAASEASGQSRPPVDKSHPDASPLRREDFPTGLAKAHVVTAGFDPLRDEGEAYAQLLEKHGTDVTSTRYPGMIHGFFNIVGVGRECTAAVRDIADELRTALA